MNQDTEENRQQVPPKVDLRKQAGQPPQGGPAPSKNLQTMHIELPDLEPDAAPAQTPPPKPASAPARPTVVVRPMPAAPAASERHQTMQINPDDLTQTPAPTQSPTVSVKPIGMPSAPGTTAPKRETSRIPLDMAKPTLGAPGRPLPGPSTIRVKPVVIRQTVDLAQAVPDGTGGSTPVLPPISPESGKRKTSRISLESVLSGQPGMASQTAEIAPPEVDEEPRTIRIKRSADRSTAKTAAAPAAPAISPGQTARLELPAETQAISPEEAGTQTPTRKKTIKVKRPGAEGGDEEGGQPAVAGVARPEPVVQSTADVPHATFGVLAVLAVLTMGVLIYVLMAQAFGPNVSLTTLSYGWPECDLGWPGKILPGPGR